MSSEAGKLTIAIVEDEEALLRSLADILESKGYRVVTAQNGTRGLSLIRTEMPDLVVLDVMMPGMNGFQVLDKVKSDMKTMDIPVILLTVRSSEADIEQGIQHLAEEYITKPFEPENLCRRIKQILETRSK